VNIKGYGKRNGNGDGSYSGWNVVDGGPGDGVIERAGSDDDLGWPRRRGGRDDRRRQD